MKLKFIALMLCFTLLCSVSCFAANEEVSVPENVKTSSTLVAPVFDEMFTNRDSRTTYTKTGIIKFSADSIKVNGDGLSAVGTVVTISEEGIFVVSGSCAEAQIIINAAEDDKVQLIFDGADLSNTDSAVVYVQQADKVFLTTAKKSENALSTLAAVPGNASEEISSEIDGTIYSTCNLTLNGLGTLTVINENGHGIVGKDAVKITSGTFNVSASKKGINANESIRIAGGTITVTSQADALHCDNKKAEKGYICIYDGVLNLTSLEGNAIDASGQVSILGGTINIFTSETDNSNELGNGSWTLVKSDTEKSVSYKNIKSSLGILCQNGTITLNTYTPTTK